MKVDWVFVGMSYGWSGILVGRGIEHLKDGLDRPSLLLSLGKPDASSSWAADCRKPLFGHSPGIRSLKGRRLSRATQSLNWEKIGGRCLLSEANFCEEVLHFFS